MADISGNQGLIADLMPAIKGNQGPITVLAEDAYLATQVEAFLIDRRAQNMSRGTLQFYVKKLEQFLRYCEGRQITRIDQITPGEIRQYLLWLEEAGHNPGGIHAYYRTLRTFLYWWENEVEPEGWKNPIRKVKAPKLSTDPLEPVSTDDVRTLVETCKAGTFHGVRDKAIIQILLDSGVRASELCNLDLADVDTTDGGITVKQGKGRKPRVTFAGKQARRALRKWLRWRGNKSGALFVTGEGDRLSYWGLREILRRRAAQAGIKEPGAHDFRRAFCLGQLQAGVPETTIARLMGHTSTQLIARYAKQTKSNLGEQYRSLLDGDK